MDNVLFLQIVSLRHNPSSYKAKLLGIDVQTFLQIKETQKYEFNEKKKVCEIKIALDSKDEKTIEIQVDEAALENEELIHFLIFENIKKENENKELK